MGTPSFAVPALRALAKEYHVTAVVTQPDRPGGRGKKMTPPPVKTAAEEMRLPVVQPVKIRDESFIIWLREISPDFLVTAAYGRILPAAVLDTASAAALNIHASLLPRYRGAAPIQRAIMNGEKESGITIIYMDEGMDTGDIAVQESVPIGHFDTAGELHDRLAVLGARMIVQSIKNILDGSARRTGQNHALATLAPPLRPEEEEIDWCTPAEAIHNLVRGMNSWPGAYTLCKGVRLKIWAGRPAREEGAPCGAIISQRDGIMAVATGQGTYKITELQPTGKRVMSAGDYLCGNNLPPGTVLGR
jgi:methionyl-tRNA formyltransferase